MKLNINGKEIEVSNDDLKKAIDENVDTFELKSDELIIRTTEEDNSYKENIRKEGLTAGTEIGRKNVIKALGIDGEGLHKSDDTAKAAIESWANTLVETKTKDLQKEPTEKIKELKKDLETLQGTISSLTQERDTFKTQLTDTQNGYEKKSILLKSIPDNTVLPKEDIISLVESKVNLKKDESGKWIGIGSDGQPIKDSVLNPVPVEEVIKGFFNDNPQYLKTPTGGAGAGDSGSGGGKQSLEDFTKEMQDKNVPINGEEFNNELQVRLKAGTLAI